MVVVLSGTASRRPRPPNSES